MASVSGDGGWSLTGSRHGFFMYRLYALFYIGGPMPEDLPEDYLREIGRVVVAWNKLESALGYALMLALLGRPFDDLRPFAVFAHMSFPQRLDTLGALLLANPNLDQAVSGEYKKVVRPLLENCAEKRNAVLHQDWSVEEDVVHRYDVRARGQVKITYVPVNITELQAASSLMEDTQLKLIVFLVLAFPVKRESAGGAKTE